MDTGGIDRIRKAIDSLHDSHTAVEVALKAFEEQDLSKENSRLRETVERLNAKLKKSGDETVALRQEHEALTSNFKHELFSKRTALLGLSERQHQAYLSAGLERERMRISTLYAELQKTMSDMSAQLHTLDVVERNPLLTEMTDLHERINEQARQS